LLCHHSPINYPRGRFTTRFIRAANEANTLELHKTRSTRCLTWRRKRGELKEEVNGARGKGREAVEESVKMSDEDILVVAKQSPRNLDVVFCVSGVFEK
jgi:hypothetical protein